MKLNPKFALAASLTVLALSTTVHAEDLSRDILVRENMVWETFVGSQPNITAFKQLLAPDYLCIEATGVLMNEAENVDQLKILTFSSFQIHDPHVIRISAKSALIVARVHFEGTAGGQKMDGETLTSTVWIKQGKTWLAQLHQETFKK
ncbi:nuclear transport factor 2 family protein [Terriglobus saanensis]|uniref:DUF4440 domain-containing protein n=1 Tax=Terriglobus saanensis (strain ATCC BAA-1853 / DSM 23119 / SP1PR4) TaxID=401053 RepID=E8V6W3_TERSS|nr:nuclear transport factor 2 family protein [Terriglobus saanensis]ADV83915.1 hypothetical protein AciPR4_3157 [Terriglobus saanensis SP1PR4]